MDILHKVISNKWVIASMLYNCIKTACMIYFMFNAIMKHIPLGSNMECFMHECFTHCVECYVCMSGMCVLCAECMSGVPDA